MTRKPPMKLRDAVPAKRCVIYVRKSTTHGLDQEFNSLDAQREACEQYVALRAADGWTMTEVYEDGGYTGANLDRPAFQRLLADIDDGKIDVVVVYKLDRLSRSLLDFTQIMSRFEEGGAAFVSVTQNFSTADPMGRLVLNILMTFAEFEREMICARTRDKIRAARRRGQWTGGVTPFGYVFEERRLRPDPERARWVRQIYDSYLDVRSANQVAAELNAAGAPPPAKEGDWTKNAVLRVLTAPVYAGLLRVGDELVDGVHEPMVSRQTWHEVQQLLKVHRRGDVARTGSDFLLGGVLRCAACGTRMVGASVRKNGKRYRYYRCLRRDKRDAAACPSGHLAAGPIEEAVADVLRQRLGEAGLDHDLVDAVSAELDAEREALRSGQTALAQRVAQLAAGRHQILSNAADPTAPGVVRALADNDAAMATARAERGTLEERLGRLASELETRAAVARSLERLDEVWELLSIENRARVVRSAVDQVTVDAANGGYQIRLASFLSQSAAATKEKRGAR